jgi:predicted RNA binding protein YcfA (HicA-like mRNA interferase family)
MPKPLGNKKLPVFKTKEFIRALEGIGFRQIKDNKNHKHIKMIIEINGKKIEHIAIKGNKDIFPITLKKAINELSLKLDIPKTKIIELLLKHK